MIGEVAVVAYLPGELAARLARIAHRLAPASPARRPHITVLPARLVPLADAALLELLRTAAPAGMPLRLRLGEVCTFLPVSPVIYLDVIALDAGLEQLRRRLLSVLPDSIPGRFPFHPHLTLAYDLPEAYILRLQPRWQRVWERLRVAWPGDLAMDELTLVRQTGDAEWRDLGTFRLTVEPPERS